MKFLSPLFHVGNIQHFHKTCIFICTDVFKRDLDDVYNAVTLYAIPKQSEFLENYKLNVVYNPIKKKGYGVNAKETTTNIPLIKLA